MSQPPVRPFDHHAAASEDDHEAMLREVEQELAEEERGEEPEPPASHRSTLVVIAAALVFAGVLAGLGALCGAQASTGAVFGLFGGACLGGTVAVVGLVPGAPKAHHAGYDGAAALAVFGILWLAAGLATATRLIV
jgi:hypothetical protein